MTMPLAADLAHRAAIDSPGAWVPDMVRAAFGHVALQEVAETAGVDLLHVKGPALDSALSWAGRTSSDADVLVRPRHLVRLLTAVSGVGWRQYDTFAASSAFSHAITFHHDWWGYADIHRLVPGFRVAPEEAFDYLWHRRETTHIAGRPCPVPDRAAQALVLLLHAARSRNPSKGEQDLDQAWFAQRPDFRDEVRRTAAILDAQMPLAVALDDDVDAYWDDPDLDLWMVLSSGGSRLREWKARIKGSHGMRGKAATVAKSVVVNTDHLAIMLGRTPTAQDVAKEVVARVARGVAEEYRAGTWRPRWPR
ncbi:MAG: nucleotidyltransferase family protein [Tetrasphaera sp.]